jgi:DNA repair protein RadC
MRKHSQSLQGNLFSEQAAPATIQGFSEASIAGLAEDQLLALFSSVGSAVSQRCLLKRNPMSSFDLVISYLKSVMGHLETEQFRILFLDKRNNLISDEVMGNGTVDHVPVYPREVVKLALQINATAMILVHNHPSGDTSPSNADIVMTKQITEVCSQLGILVHDHIIIGRNEHTSLKQRGLI